MKEISLATLHGGVAMDLFSEELRKVMENIADPNATPDAVRTISIKVRIKPDKERRFATTTVSSSSTLAPVSPTEGTMFFRSAGGSLSAYEDDWQQKELADEAGRSIFEMPKAQEGGSK